MEVSFILVNFNTTALLAKCLQALYQFTGTTAPGFLFEVWVVDNASSQDPQPILAAEFPQVNFLYAPKNNGFGAANNLAIPLAKGKYMFFLNPDAFLQNDAAAILAAKMNAPEFEYCGICGGELLNEQGIPNQCFGNFPTLAGAIAALGFKFLMPNYYRKHLATGVANYNALDKKVDYVSGAAFMVRKKLIEQYGGFDEAFFLFFEETEWAWRLKQQGWYCMVFPEVKITHLEGGSTELGSYQLFNERTFRLFAQSRQLFYKKTRGVFFAAIMKPLDCLADIMQSLYRREGVDVLYKKCSILWKA